MSQYSSPEGVFFSSPVTFVGAVVFGCAADEAFFVVLLCANTAVAASATIATRSVYFIINSAPLRKFNPGERRVRRDFIALFLIVEESRLPGLHSEKCKANWLFQSFSASFSVFLPSPTRSRQSPLAHLLGAAPLRQ